MISKELLEAVLGYPKMVITNVPYIINIIGKPYLFPDNTENIWFNTDNVGLGVCKINKYVFAFKCKEWAYSTYGIMIQSYPYCGKGRADAIKGLKVDEAFKEKTEPEAIFKAAQWVLDNVKTTSLP